MVEIKKIVYPVDFTENSEKVLPYVKLMVERLGADLDIVHVVKSAEEFAGYEMGAALYTTWEKELTEGAQKAMERFVEDHMSDIKNVGTSVLIGDPVEEIVDYATKNNVGLIVIGTHGRKGLERILFGSVAEGVVKNAPCPVLSVNPFRLPS